MKIIINSNSMIPIYEQITGSIKQMIASGSLKAGDPLPSVRTLSSELRISALTVKKAYDRLEEEGFTATVHGKGTYVTGANISLMREEQQREIENSMEKLVEKARSYGIGNDEIRELLEIILEA